MGKRNKNGDTYVNSVKKIGFRKAVVKCLAVAGAVIILLFMNGNYNTKAATTDGSGESAGSGAEIRALICSHEPKPGTYVITVSETCTNDGMARYTCIYCKNKVLETRTAKGHSWGSWRTVTKAQCETEGKKERTCSECHIKESSIIPVKGHSWGSWRIISEAGCEKDGSREHTCSVCHSTENEIIPQTGHDISLYFTIRIPATCNSDGLEGKQCTRPGCGYWSVKSANKKVIPKTGHSWGEWSVTKEAGCSTPGERKRTCSICGETATEEIPKLEHNISSDFSVKVSATCETPGAMGKKCMRSGCDYWSVKKENNKETAPLGHDYQLIRKISDATCTETGKLLFRCLNPGCEQPEEIMETETLKHISGFPQGYMSLGNGLHVFYFTCTKCREIIPDLSTVGYCSYHEKYYGNHTLWGHLIYKKCSCGYWDTFGYETDFSCLSCTTPPDLRITGIEPGAFINRSGIEKVLPPRVLVQDNEEDEIYIYWLLDGKRVAGDAVKRKISKNGTELTLSGSPDFSSLSEGKHTVKVVADDPAAPDGSAEIIFIYDNTAPYIYGNTETVQGQGSISVSCHAKDLLSEEVSFRMKAVKREDYSGIRINEYLADVPFLPAVNISSDTDGNLFYVSSVFDDLEQGKDYVLLISLRDAAGNEEVYTENTASLGDGPRIDIRTRQDSSAEIIITDVTPGTSKYIITAASETGTFTVSETGMLKGYTAGTDLSECAVLLCDDGYGRKTVTACGFAYETVYTVMAGRLNTDGSISWSSPKNIICDRNPHVADFLKAPGQVNAVPEGNTVTVFWESVEGATVYDIEIDGMLYSAGTELFYVHRGLEPGSVHEYRVRGRNSSVKGNLSYYVCAETNQTEDPSDSSENSGEAGENPESGGNVETGENSGDSDENEEGNNSGEQTETPLPKEPCITVNSAGKTYISISWEASGKGAVYEVLFDGISVYTGNVCRYTFTGLIPGSSHSVSVSVCCPDASVYSYAVISTLSEENMHMVTDRKPAVTSAEPFNAVSGKTYRVLIPLHGVKADSRYSLEIVFNENEVSIEDLFEPTSERETYDCAPEGTGRSLTLRHENGKLVVSVIWETAEESAEGIMADFLVRAQASGIISFEYR